MSNKFKIVLNTEKFYVLDMKFKLEKVEAYFLYGPVGAEDNRLTLINIKEEYQKLGGTITPETEIEFDSFFLEKHKRNIRRSRRNSCC
jgi:hypothetical protein